MLPSELMKQIHLLEIRSSKAVEEITGGAYCSVFKGRGIEFEEVREYTQEDDIRDIDWNVSARMGTPYIKKYVEERELNVLFLVDVSASGAFGSTGKTKRQSATELAALLAFSAGRNHDKVGMLLFSDRIEEYLVPRSGRKNTLRLIRDLLAFEPKGKGTDLNMALREARMLLNKRTVIFLVSDFETEQDFSKSLRILNRRHDVIAIRVLDPLEKEWPFAVNIGIEDAETGEVMEFSGSSSALRSFEDNGAALRRKSLAACDKARVDLIDLECGEEPLRPLIQFFEKRKKHNQR